MELSSGYVYVYEIKEEVKKKTKNKIIWWTIIHYIHAAIH